MRSLQHKLLPILICKFSSSNKYDRTYVTIILSTYNEPMKMHKKRCEYKEIFFSKIEFPSNEKGAFQLRSKDILFTKDYYDSRRQPNLDRSFFGPRKLRKRNLLESFGSEEVKGRRFRYSLPPQRRLDSTKFRAGRIRAARQPRTRSGKSRRLRRRGRAQHPVCQGACVRACVHRVARVVHARVDVARLRSTQNNADGRRHILFIEQRPSWDSG